MRIDQQLSDEAVLAEVGARIARTRLARNLTQGAVAEEAGVGRKALQRLEAGEPVQLVTLVRVLRALGLLAALDALVTEPLASPIELLEREGRARRRASGGRATAADDREPEPWRWGDEPA